MKLSSDNNEELLLENRRVKEFIKRRSFTQEDYVLINGLGLIPKNILVSEFHNFFTFAENRALNELDLLIENLEKQDQSEEIEQTILAAQKYRAIVEKYDWLTAHDLNSILETL